MGIIAGVLLVLLSIAHNIYGEKKQIPDLKAVTNDAIIIGSTRVMIFQGGLLLLAVGVVQILVAVDALELTGAARFFPVGIVVLNLSTFLFVALTLHKELLRITVPQLVIFGIIIGLQVLSL